MPWHAVLKAPAAGHGAAFTLSQEAITLKHATTIVLELFMNACDWRVEEDTPQTFTVTYTRTKTQRG